MICQLIFQSATGKVRDGFKRVCFSIAEYPILKLCIVSLWICLLNYSIVPNALAQKYVTPNKNEGFLLDQVRALELDSLQKKITTVHFTPSYRNRAEMLGARTERALQFFNDSLNIAISEFHLIMPDTTAWKELSEMPYGFPVWGLGGWQLRNLGRSVSGRPPSAIVPLEAGGIVFRQLQNMKRCLSDDDRVQLQELGFSWEEASHHYVETITIHELGHAAVGNLEISIPTDWFSEFLANYFTAVYLNIYEPKQTKIWDLMTEVSLECYSPDKNALEVFYLPGNKGPDYHWIQSNLIQRANRVVEDHGLDFITEVQKIFPENDTLSQKVEAIYEKLDSLSKEETHQRFEDINKEMIQRLKQLDPGFQDWATTLFGPAAVQAQNRKINDDHLHAQHSSFDLLILDGQIIDGTGSAKFKSDVGIKDDKIAAIGDLSKVKADRTINANGLIVAPGFIDGHSHAARGLTDSTLSAARSLLAQGITTVVVNPDGGGPADLTQQRNELFEDGIGVNVFQLVPYGSVRTAIMGKEDRPPTSAEQNEILALIKAGMEEGAIGLSTGLFYPPGTYAKTDEIVKAAQVASRYGGAYQSHVRDEGGYSVGVLAANRELIEIARRADLPAIHTHIKAFGPQEMGLSNELVSQIQDARAEGLSVFADLYPYRAAGGSVGGILVPRGELSGGPEALRKEIESDSAARQRVRKGIQESIQLEGGPSNILLRNVTEAPELVGMTLQEAAESRNTKPASLAINLFLNGWTSFVTFGMKEQDIETFLRQPWTMIASDGRIPPPDASAPHPRSYGTFPKIIETHVQMREVLDLEEAIWRMTALYREAYPIQERGLLKEGMKADVVVFDPDRVRAPSSYLQPRQIAEGMVHVLVNGNLAIREGEFTETRAGRVLDSNSTTR